MVTPNGDPRQVSEDRDEIIGGPGLVHQFDAFLELLGVKTSGREVFAELSRRAFTLGISDPKTVHRRQPSLACPL